MGTEITHLNLVSPLYYVSVEKTDPFVYDPEDGEMLYCYELNEAERLNFEPEIFSFLGKMIFGGKAAAALPGAQGKNGGIFFELPPGNYLFAQQRKILGKDEIIALAVEIQQEGLWRRMEPGKELYIRRLFEDGGCVTQLFRPIRKQA